MFSPLGSLKGLEPIKQPNKLNDAMSKKIMNLKGVSTAGMKKLEGALRKELGFKKVSISLPSRSCNANIFDMSVSIENEDNYQIVKLESSPQKISLSFHDAFHCGENFKIFILTSYPSLCVFTKNKSICIYGGDSVIIPSWCNFSEFASIRRSSISILLDVVDIFSDEERQLMSSLFFKKISDFKYGRIINDIIINNISTSNPTFDRHKSAIDAIKGLLHLEIDCLRFPLHLPSTTPPSACDLNGIVLFVKNNFKNPDFNVSCIAKFLSISERMLQYKLSKYNLKPSQIIYFERSRALAMYIKDYPYLPISSVIFECGYKSIETARRHFKEFFGLTITEYVKKCRFEGYPNSGSLYT